MPVRSDVVIIAEQGRWPRIECRGGIAARSTAPDTVHLVSAAATPLGGDEITFRIVVESGARLRLRSVAAAIVLPGRQTAQSHTSWDIDVGGDFDLDPEPTVVAAAARHLGTTRIHLTPTARVRVRERVQIGRTDEREGFWSGALHANVSDIPLLRHRVEIGSGSVTDDTLGPTLACVSELRFPEIATDAAGTTLELAAGGSLSTWLGGHLPADF